MSQILQKLRDVNPNDSDAVKEVITSFFQNLSKYKVVNCNIWLRGLEDIITRFPRYCSQHRTAIENYLASFLDSSNYYNVISAAKCAHGLQQIRPSQDKVATPKNCWREQMNILCNTAHTLIEAVFSKTVSIYKNSKNNKKNDGDLLSYTPLTCALSSILNVKKHQGDKQMVLCTKLRNIFVFIQAMLVEVYPVAKPVQPQLILEVIVQALSMSSSVNTDVTEAVTVKLEALRTLDALIACLGPNLIPFSGLVFRLVMQPLRWSSDNPSDESRKVRIASYKTLVQWLSILHVHRVASDGRKSWEDELTTHLIDDITPPKKIVQFNMSTDYVKKLSKKARRKLVNTQLLESKLASHMPGEKNKENECTENNDEIVNAALECTNTFLNVCGIFLKSTTHKLFQERLVRECFNLDSYSTTRGLYLLQALESTRKNTPPSTPPPTQYCLQLYSTLVNSSSNEIRKYCSEALLDIRLHLHHSPPSLTYALTPEAIGDKTNKKKKELSKRNRAALEEFLGRDRLNETLNTDNRNSEDVIHDEETNGPISKKQRTEDDSVMIDISSDSENSVVISDDSGEDIEEVSEVTEDSVDGKMEDRSDLIETGKRDAVVSIDSRETAILITVDSSETSDSNRTVHTINADTSTTADSNKAEESIKSDQDIEDNVTKPNDIFTAETQIHFNASPETIQGDKSPVSMEVAYDIPIPSTGSRVTVLEKMDGDNLPSSNDTDDVQITCGQIVMGSQEAELKDKVEVDIEISNVDSTPTNGINESDEIEDINHELTNGEVLSQKTDGNENLEVKIISKEVTVEDMLADFVDEVNEEPSVLA